MSKKEEDDFIGSPIGYIVPEKTKLEGVELERDMDPKIEQLMGIIWILMRQHANLKEVTIPFEDFIKAQNEMANLRINVSPARESVTITAGKGIEESKGGGTER